MKPQPLIARVALAAPLLLCLASLSGCDIIGALGSKLPPSAVQAVYKPPQTPMLVMVESYQTSGLDGPAAELTQILVTRLKEHNIAPVIEPSALARLRSSRGEHFGDMKISEVGKAVGARQVLYVNLHKCVIDGFTNSELIKGQIDTTVRVVNVQTGRTAWPADADPFPISEESKFATPQQAGNPNELRHNLLASVATRMTRLFYKYDPDYDASEDEPEKYK